jgi:hypothetical protein
LRKASFFSKITEATKSRVATLLHCKICVLILTKNVFGYIFVDFSQTHLLTLDETLTSSPHLSKAAGSSASASSSLSSSEESSALH